MNAGCGGNNDVIVKTGADKKLTDTQIDGDPVALLPSNAVGIAYVDAKKALASPFGARILAVAERRMPLPPTAGFEPKRDLEALWIGLYSMQGADVAGVAIGTRSTSPGTPVSPCSLRESRCSATMSACGAPSIASKRVARKSSFPST